MHEIEIINDADYLVDAARLQRAATAVLDQETQTVHSLTIVLSNNADVQALNLHHRGVDAPTDVLSFPAEPLPPELQEVTETEVPYCGDLIIAYPYTQAQAATLKHALSDNLALLVVHGTLHLLGYDHDTTDTRRTMWAAQAKALATLGISSSIVPALEANDHAG